MKIVLEGQEAVDYMNGVVRGQSAPPATDEAPTRRSRRPKSEAQKAEDIGQLPVPASAAPAPEPKKVDANAVVRQYAAKFGTPKLVEKLTAAKVKRVPEIKPENLPLFVETLQKEIDTLPAPVTPGLA